MHNDKLAAQKQWNQTPCGSGDHLKELEYGSLAYFDEVRRSRYEDTDPWMKETIDFQLAKGKKLLEIGHGMGSDLLTFAEAGAEVYGIDITEEHHRLAKTNFALHGQPVELKLCDAAHIAYPDAFFDVVYSHGVLHHTPDTACCIREALRVLKPGGTFILSLYHTFSAFLLLRVLLKNGLWDGNWRRLGYRGLLSTIERGADGIQYAPLVKTYHRWELARLLADFSQVRFRIAHFKREHVPLLGKILPRAWEKPLSRLFGWYIVAEAVK